MKSKSPLFYLTIVFLIAFAPITSFVFALKNDFFLGYFPPKFLLSETLSSGQFPLWNPYISFGLPFYADMNGAYWNPITWIIALSTGYNAYTLTIELLLYVLLGGLGMFKLAKHFSTNIHICIIAGLAFLCNGFVIGHLQHLNWISCSAFLPWCIWGILTIEKKPSLRNILYTVFAFFFLITASHPGMIIGGIYFFSALLIFILYRKLKDESPRSFKSAIKNYSVFFILLIVLSLGVIVSYLDILPHFARNSKVDLELSLTENTTVQSWISLFLPFSTVKNELFFKNDIALRNSYIGLVLFGFLILSLFSVKTKQQKFFLLLGSGFLLLSLGNFIKLFTAKYFPLIGYVRVNGEFRIFAIISFIIVAIISLDSYIKSKSTQPEYKLKLILRILLTTYIGITIVSIIRIGIGNTGSIFKNTNINSWRDNLKSLITGLHFNETLLIQSVIQMILLIFILKALRSKNLQKIIVVTAFDLTIATLLNIPFTGVGKVPVAKLHAIHQGSPKGIPIPKVEALKLHASIPNNDSALVGDWTFYNKQIGSPKAVLYPVKITDNLLFYDLLYKDSSLTLKDYPFIFLSSSINRPKLKSIQNLHQEDIISYSTNKIHLKFSATNQGYLVFLQNNYPHWYYKNGSVISKPDKAGVCFMGVPVKKGINDVSIYFKPTSIIVLFIFTVLILLLFTILLFLPFSERTLFHIKNDAAELKQF